MIELRAYDLRQIWLVFLEEQATMLGILCWPMIRRSHDNMRITGQHTLHLLLVEDYVLLSGILVLHPMPYCIRSVQNMSVT